MAKNGYKTFDRDMHVFEPADLHKIYESEVERMDSTLQAQNKTWHDTLLLGDRKPSARRVALSKNVSRLEGNDYGVPTLSADTPHGVSNNMEFRLTN